MEEIEVKVQKGPGARMLEYQSAGAAGADLRACLEEPITLLPGRRIAVPTGLRIELPEGWEAQIRPRSGLALNHGITCLNSPGTIDSDYRGEVRVILANLGDESFRIKDGDRIAQFVVAPVARARFLQSGRLENSARGDRGFGSTGVE